MIMPTDVAIGRAGRIYVVDSGNQRVLVYDTNGAFLSTFGSSGTGADTLVAPVGIATAGDGSVFVADRAARRVQIFDADGTFLHTLVTRVGMLEIAPVDVAVDPDGERVYVTATAPYNRVLVYGQQGRIERIWGIPGNNPGEFRYPATLAVAPTNEIYIVDVFNTRVQVLDRRGKYLVAVGSWGVTPGQFFRPKGVALRSDGSVLVSDSYLGVIQLFNEDTRLRGVVGYGGEFARFDTPAGLAVDGSNRLYVAEMLANKVSVLQLEP
jgi:DNA-binding beta-propeller fold protein YncE